MSAKSHRMINVSSSHEQAAIKAAREVVQLLHSKPNAVIGLATGNTMLPLYAELVRMHKEEGLDYSQATFFNLDEYLGIPHNHPASFHTYMQRNLFNHINARKENIHIPESDMRRAAGNAYHFDNAIEHAGGMDLLLLGLGTNGHIGFNEPGTAFDTQTRMVELAQATRENAKASFGGLIKNVPRYGLTMGIGTIMDAKKILMLATGASKAKAARGMMLGDITPDLPATVLRNHPKVNYYFDQAAFSLVGRPTANPAKLTPA